MSLGDERLDVKETSENFIEKIIQADIALGKNGGQVVTRFPPEPNGWLHIGHAKSIFLNWGLSKTFNGRFHLRFDDTNPEAEDIRYIEAIKRDMLWLGANWGEHLYYASDYFEELYQLAEELIEMGKAYVCDLSPKQMREYRGSVKEAGRPSPNRDRSPEENRALFRKMRSGEFKDGEKVLRAKIDMSSPNMNMRDPAIYRIRKALHPRTGGTWKIYPMYDFTHCLSDSIEGVSHSVCTLEFEDHRPLYEWVLETLNRSCKPKQIEFARLNLEHTIMSKRHLLKLVQGGFVTGWDDPRMPTISGMRRRGVPASAIQQFCERIGVTKKGSSISMSSFEACIRESLDPIAIRRMVVLNPLKLTLTNYESSDPLELISAKSHPKDESFGRRNLTMSKEIFIDADDFTEDPPKKYFRLAPGKEVRLKNSYVIRCNEVVRDPLSQKIIELKCTYEPSTLGGKQPEGRKVKGIIHWVSAQQSTEITVQLFDRLLKVKGSDEAPTQKQDDLDLDLNLNLNSDVPSQNGPLDKIKEQGWIQDLNPDSKIIVINARAENALSEASADQHFQFERVGFFCLDQDSQPGEKAIFNRIVSLKDTWKS